MQHLTMTDDELDSLLATGEIPVVLRWVSAERIKGSNGTKAGPRVRTRDGAVRTTRAGVSRS